MPNSTWALAVERASAYAEGVKATSNATMTKARKTMGVPSTIVTRLQRRKRIPVSVLTIGLSP